MYLDLTDATGGLNREGSLGWAREGEKAGQRQVTCEA